jgi:hypothetical protein
MTQHVSILQHTRHRATVAPIAPNPKITQQIDALIDCHLHPEHLRDRLADLPQQFRQPQPRPWQPIDWQKIEPSQIVGIEIDVFLAILRGAIDTEASIRPYTQASRQYLEPLHPAMARFVGGRVDGNGTLIEPGLWEKEERQHTPALVKIYRQLAAEKPPILPHEARPYQPAQDPGQDLYRHGLHRVATEYGATCLYLWLMAHTTGALRQVLAELTTDEVNHMTKFWGFGVWAYPDTGFLKVCRTLLHTSQGRLTYQRQRSSLLGTLHRMTQELAWPQWSWHNRYTFTYTSFKILHRLWDWSDRLQSQKLNQLFESQH